MLADHGGTLNLVFGMLKVLTVKLEGGKFWHL